MLGTRPTRGADARVSQPEVHEEGPPQAIGLPCEAWVPARRDMPARVQITPGSAHGDPHTWRLLESQAKMHVVWGSYSYSILARFELPAG